MQITQLWMCLYTKRFIRPELAPCIIIIGSSKAQHTTWTNITLGIYQACNTGTAPLSKRHTTSASCRSCVRRTSEPSAQQRLAELQYQRSASCNSRSRTHGIPPAVNNIQSSDMPCFADYKNPAVLIIRGASRLFWQVKQEILQNKWMEGYQVKFW